VARCVRADARRLSARDWVRRNDSCMYIDRLPPLHGVDWAVGTVVRRVPREVIAGGRLVVRSVVGASGGQGGDHEM